MPYIHPTHQQLETLSRIPENGPWVMVNLLRFKPGGGAESYQEYSRRVVVILERIGARVIYYGKGIMTFIGEEQWDACLLVEYPSKTSFIAMLNDPEYQQAVSYRTNALMDSRLHITTSLF